jgi:hypothetical protein
MTTHPLVALLTAAFEGDPYAVHDAFSDDATLQDTPGEPVSEGHDELVAHFAAYGGRRERFTVEDLVDAGDRLAIRYALRFRADAHAYAQRGVAILDLDAGRINRWRGVWVETEEDLAAWSDD